MYMNAVNGGLKVGLSVLQQFCQESTSGFRDMLSYQYYKMSEVGSGVSIITVNIYLPQAAQQNTDYY